MLPRTIRHLTPSLSPFEAERETLFSEPKAGLVKIIGQNHQFPGVNNAIASMLATRKLRHGRGVVRARLVLLPDFVL